LGERQRRHYFYYERRVGCAAVMVPGGRAE
jgi:hypothetical protein